jgi:hypothetical protein
VLRAAGEAETTQENIQDWLQLDERDFGFQLLTEEEISAVTLFIIYFHQHYLYDRLCGLVVRLPGYRSRGPGSIPGATKFSEK